jgi:hypothetical protein
MCGSPKSSGTTRKSGFKGVSEKIPASFVTKANAAQDRRSELRKSETKHSQLDKTNALLRKGFHKKSPPVKENLILSFLKRIS